MGYQTIEVRKLTPAIGAEIFGVDLAEPLGNQAFQEIHDALMENLVIFFRDQELTHEQHKVFGRRFGELHLHPTSTRGDGEHPEILVIKADAHSKHVAGEEWHSDVSCDAEPPMGSILYMKELPPDGGGNTRNEHPVVRTHPVTGRKALYVNRNFTTHIAGLRRHESDALLEMLYRH